MKILVFSDTHGNVELVKRALNEHISDTDLILHLGDSVSDTTVFTNICPHIANINIFGNCDYFCHGVDACDEKTFVLGTTGLRAFACHGHNYCVNKDIDILYSKSKLEKVSISFYGHTHVANITEKNGIILLNPGSASAPRGTEPASYGIVNIANNNISPSIIFAW